MPKPSAATSNAEIARETAGKHHRTHGTEYLAPLAWILIVRHRQWSPRRKGLTSIGALVRLSIAAVVLSVVLNGVIAALGPISS